MRINYFVAGGFVVLIFLVIIFTTAVLPAATFKPCFLYTSGGGAVPFNVYIFGSLDISNKKLT